MVKNWLIRVLGGYSLQEITTERSYQNAVLESLQNNLQTKDTLISLKQVELEGIRKQIEDITKDRDFYREKLFLEKGILFHEVEVNSKREHIEPISRTREPWSIRRRRLEADDLKKAEASRANAQAQVDATKSHWDKKNQAAQEKEDAVQ